MKKLKKIRKLSRKGIAIFGVAVLLFSLSFEILAVENYRPVVTTTPDRKWTIANYLVGAEGSHFSESTLWSGIISYDPEDGDLTSKVVMTGTVDINTIGTYHVEFNVQDSGGLFAIPFVREINVREKGTLTPGRCYESIDPPDVYTVECENIPQCSDSTDNDGDGKIDGEDPACHTDFYAGNPSSYDPKIDTENQKPVITLLGDDPLTHTKGQNFSDPGSQASDPEDGDLTSDIVVSGDEISTSTATGTYTIFYNVEDSQGLKADEVSRIVNVVEPEGLQPPCDSYGDIHMDGVLNELDYFDYVVHGSGGFDLSPEQQARADVDGDGDIDVGDALMVMAYISGEISTFPVCQETECSDGIDNDDDGLIDENDPGCEDKMDDSEQDPLPRITVCKIITDELSQIKDGSLNQGTFTLPGPFRPLFATANVTSSVPTTTFSTPLSLNADLLNEDSINDAQCTAYEQMPYSNYFFDREIVEGDNWLEPLYYVALAGEEVSLGKFATFSDEYYTEDPADDGSFPKSSGIVDMYPPGLTIPGVFDQTVVVWNRYQSTQPPENQKPVITLLGDNPMTHIQGDIFADPGATSSDPEDGDLTSDIVVSGDEISTSTATGTYTIFYNVEDSQGLKADEVSRAVNVIEQGQVFQCSDGIDNDGDGLIDENDPGCESQTDDSENEKPIINLLGDNPMTHIQGDIFADPGATSSDPEDGDLTSDIVVSGDEISTSTATGTYVILYNVQDSEGLKADEVSRTVNVMEYGQTECSDSIDNDGDGFIDDEDPTCHTDGDAGNPASYDPGIDTENQAPVITLIGADEIPVAYAGAFTDPGATAHDFEDGDLTSDIVVSGDVIESTSPGAYSIFYNVQDSQGKKAQEVKRTVQVQEAPGGHTGPGGGSVIIVSSPTLIISEEKVQDNKDSTALVSWKTNASSTSQVVYGKESISTLGEASDNYGYASSTVEATALTTSHLIFVSGLEQGVKYYFRPVSDNAESREAVGKEVSFEEEEIITPPVVTECNYLLEYLKIDKVNNPVEVMKLQTFLNTFEGFSLEVSGIFDEATFNAVSAFQLKYSEDVLVPWGVDFSTGYVYITTKKKVNELYCQREFPLTSSQEAEVASFRTWFETAPEQVIPEGEPIGMEETEEGLAKEETPTTTQEVVAGETPTTTEELVLDESGLVEEEDRLADLAIAGFSTFRSKAISWLALILVILLLLYAILYFRLRKKKETPYPAPPQNIPTA